MVDRTTGRTTSWMGLNRVQGSDPHTRLQGLGLWCPRRPPGGTPAPPPPGSKSGQEVASRPNTDPLKNSRDDQTQCADGNRDGAVTKRRKKEPLQGLEEMEVFPPSEPTSTATLNPKPFFGPGALFINQPGATPRGHVRMLITTRSTSGYGLKFRFSVYHAKTAQQTQERSPLAHV